MHEEQHIPDDTIQIRLIIASVATAWIAGLSVAISALV